MHIAILGRHRRPKQSGGLLALRFAVIVLAAILLGIVVSALAMIAVAGGVYASYVQDLPSAEEISRMSVETFETTRIYDRTGQHLLYELIPTEGEGGRRTWVPLSRIPAHLRTATIAMEDKTFYTNPAGINVEGVLRAIDGVIRGEYAGGGSSIPQQLVKNIIMTHEERMERSYSRKIKEMVLAVELTRRYPGIEGRDRILEWYLNNVFYGHFAFGVEAAAQTYFDKPVEDLTLAEAAMIVPIGQSPAINPIDEPVESKKRQEIVLDQLYMQGKITAEEAWAAKQESLLIAPPGFDITAPHFVLYVRGLLEAKYGSEAVYGGGLQVISSIDLDIQAEAQRLAREQVDSIRQERNANNAAVIVLDTKTAELIAMVGSLDYDDALIDGRVNMALSPRQPGSSFKPFTYATAFAQGLPVTTMVMDVRTSFPDPPNPAPYVPENYSRNYHGPMLLRRALACSYNIPAVAVAQRVGTAKVVETAQAMGITTLNAANYGLSLTLGGAEVTLLDMAYGFSVFANGGVMLGEPIAAERFDPEQRRLDPVSILKVTDAKGAVLYEYQEPKRHYVIPPEVAFLVTDILSDNQARSQAFGPNSVLNLENRPAAAKTGTTNDYHDGWTIGYTPQYVTGVWVGNSDYEKMKNASGVRVAGPIWQALMEHLHEGLPIEGFTRPPGLETAVVDGISGKLPTEYSPWRTQELFIEGTLPTEEDDIHIPYQVCKVTGLLATPYCPVDQVETVVYEIYPPQADDWVREQEIPQPPSEHCNVHGPNLANADVAIVQPRLFQIVRGEALQIVGNAKAGGQHKYWLEYGQGMNPGLWVPIGPAYEHRVDNSVLGHWDTSELSGLYTLRLSALDGGTPRHFAVQVLVDNSVPDVAILEPVEDDVFEMEKDEWINIQVEAQDNTSMQKVEFYLDNVLLDYTTVSPYSLRWTLSMSNTPPTAILPNLEAGTQLVGDEIIQSEVFSETDRLTYRQTVQHGEAISVTQVTRGPEEWYSYSLPTGFSAVKNEGGYTETHAIHIVAFDSVGNEIKSDPVRVHLIPKQEEKKDE